MTGLSRAAVDLKRIRMGRKSERRRCYFFLFQFKGVRDLRVEEGVESMLEVVSALRALKTSYGIAHDRVTGMEREGESE